MSPGPGDYTLRHIQGTFPKQSRFRDEGKGTLPGPGAYEQKAYRDLADWNKRSYNLRYQPIMN
jgi:hypothetical protein